MQTPFTAGQQLNASDLNNAIDQIVSLSAGENIAALYPVGFFKTWIIFGGHDLQNSATAFGRTGANNNKLGQAFQLTDIAYIKDLEIYLKKSGSPADNLLIQLQTDSAGSPSGSVVDTITIAGSSLTTSLVYKKLAFANTNKLTANTKYWIVLTRSGSLDDTNYYWVAGRNQDNSVPNKRYKPYYSGAWQDAGAVIGFPFVLHGESDVVYVSNPVGLNDANCMINPRQNFVGFATAAITSGNAGNIQRAGVLDGFSSLTVGAEYFVQDGSGTLGTTPTEIFVGTAISATQILIGHRKTLTRNLSFLTGGNGGNGNYYCYWDFVGTASGGTSTLSDNSGLGGSSAVGNNSSIHLLGVRGGYCGCSEGASFGQIMSGQFWFD